MAKTNKLSIATSKLSIIVTIIAITNHGAIAPINAHERSESNLCLQIRNVRQLADRDNLDETTLEILERQYCDSYYSPTPISPVNDSQDCQDLTVMFRLSRMSKVSLDLSRQVSKLQTLVCQGVNLRTGNLVSWANGQRAKLGSNWSYPNGQTAKLGSNWYYPNGQTAKLGSNWSYPNGQTAKLGSNWYYPNGQLASIGNRSKDFWQDLTILENLWYSY